MRSSPALGAGRSSFDSPAESPGFLLWRATLAWQRAVDEALRSFGLTHARFALLATLWWWGTVRDDRPTQRALGAAAGLDAMTASQVARALERRHLLVRIQDPRDSRALQLSITSDGRRLAARAVRAVESVDDSFFAPAGGSPGLVAALRVLAGVEP
jgi:DNA-binding MarR family transcriptional regulator